MTVVLLRRLRDRMVGRARDESGETLIELMVTVILLGVAIVAILSGLFAAVVASDRHRRVTRTGIESVTLSEAVYGAPYVRCGGTLDALTEYRKVYGTGGGAQAPSGYSYSVASVKFLESKAATTPTWAAACPSADQGAQLVELHVTGDKLTNTEKLWIVKRDPS